MFEVNSVKKITAATTTVTKTIADVDLRDVTVIDGGQGHAIAGAAMGRARMLSESLATLESVLGIDLRTVTKNIAGNLGKADGGDGATVIEPPPPATA